MLQPQTSVQDSTFKRVVDVVIEINAEPDAVWALLTDASGFNAGVEGKIALGERLAVNGAGAMPIGFRVSEFDPPLRMSWRSGGATKLRVRAFRLRPLRWRRTRFTMSETVSGPRAASADLADLVPLFARYAEDLKQAAEGANAARVA